MKVNIKLGKKNGCCETMPSPISNTTYYPSLYLSGEKVELPNSGEITLKFKKVSETKSTRDGETHFSVELDILEICEVEGKEENEKEDSGDALDKLKNEAEDSEEEDD